MVNASDLLINPPENTTTVEELAVYTNDVTNGLYGVGILISVFAVSYLYMSSRTRGLNSLVASMFTTSITSIFLFLMGLVGGEIPIALILGLVSLSTLNYFDQSK